MIDRYLKGAEWLDSIDKTRSYLAETKTLVPKVQLRKAQVSELVSKAELLIQSQDSFWSKYKTWLEQQFCLDDLTKIRSFFS